MYTNFVFNDVKYIDYKIRDCELSEQTKSMIWSFSM